MIYISPRDRFINLQIEIDRGGPNFTGSPKDVEEARKEFWRSQWLQFRNFNISDLGKFIFKVNFFKLLRAYQEYDKLPKELKINGLYFDFLNEGFREEDFDEIRYLETCAKVKYALGKQSVKHYKDKGLVREGGKGFDKLSEPQQADFRLCIKQFEESREFCQVARKKLEINIAEQVRAKADAEVKKKIPAEKHKKKDQQAEIDIEAATKALKELISQEEHI